MLMGAFVWEFGLPRFCVCSGGGGEGVWNEVECLPLCIPQLVCSLKQENESHKVVVRPVQSKQANQSRKYLFPEV